MSLRMARSCERPLPVPSRAGTLSLAISGPLYDRIDMAIDVPALAPTRYHRIVKVARTIADVSSAAGIETPHVAEAIGYRRELGLAS